MQPLLSTDSTFPFRNRSFLMLIAFRIQIFLAYHIIAVVVGWHIYALTHDPLALGLIGLAEDIPYFAARCLPAMPSIIIRGVRCASCRRGQSNCAGFLRTKPNGNRSPHTVDKPDIVRLRQVIRGHDFLLYTFPF